MYGIQSQVTKYLETHSFDKHSLLSSLEYPLIETRIFKLRSYLRNVFIVPVNATFASKVNVLGKVEEG